MDPEIVIFAMFKPRNIGLISAYAQVLSSPLEADTDYWGACSTTSRPLENWGPYILAYELCPLNNSLVLCI